MIRGITICANVALTCCSSPSPSTMRDKLFAHCMEHVSTIEEHDCLEIYSMPASSGDEPDAAPLTDPDAPAHAHADVSAHKAALSKRALAAAKPEPAHV